jgi:hypothetical protein
MRRVAVCLAVLAAASISMYAQEYRATINGVITDPSGAFVPGARVSAINLETGVALHFQANAQGRYVIPYLVPGQYKVRVEHEGFKSVERTPIELRIADRKEVNIQLEIGAISDNVTVVGAAALLETSSASGGQVIDNRRITDLPLNGRNPLQLSGGHPGIQGADQYVRRAIRAHRGRCDQPLHQARHEQGARRGLRISAAHEPDRQYLCQ